MSEDNELEEATLSAQEGQSLPEEELIPKAETLEEELSNLSEEETANPDNPDPFVEDF